MIQHLYFWFFALLMVATTLGRTVLYFAKPGSVSTYDLVESLPGLACVVALYGFTYGVLIGSKSIWLVLAFVIPVAYVVSMRSKKTRLAVSKIGLRKAILLFGAAFLLTLPAYVELLLYANRFE
jgi:hypothetical protein